MTSFYDEAELRGLGFKRLGSDVYISKLARFYNPQSISIESHVRIDDFAILSGEISIGSFVHIGAHTQIVGGGFGVIIEDFVGISGGAKVYALSDDYSGNSLTNPLIPIAFKRIVGFQITLCKHSIIGSNSVILPNSRGLSFGVSVGALSLVVRPTKPFGIYFGIPARQIATRSKDMLRIEESFKNSLMGGGREGSIKDFFFAFYIVSEKTKCQVICKWRDSHEAMSHRAICEGIA